MPEKNYNETSIENAVKEHLEKHPDFPINFQIGNSHINLNYASLRNLNKVFEKYKDKLYDSNKCCLDFEDNPNIKTVSSAEAAKYDKKHSLNNILITDTLNILAYFNNRANDAYIVFRSFNSTLHTTNNPGNATVDFIFVDSTGVPFKKEENLKKYTENGYILLSEFPLRKNMSRDMNYFSFIKSLKGKDILNPKIKLYYDPKYDVFQILPKEWKKFENTFNSKQNVKEEKNSKPEKLLSSSLTKSKRSM